MSWSFCILHATVNKNISCSINLSSNKTYHLSVTFVAQESKFFLLWGWMKLLLIITNSQPSLSSKASAFFHVVEFLCTASSFSSVASSVSVALKYNFSIEFVCKNDVQTDLGDSFCAHNMHRRKRLIQLLIGEMQTFWCWCRRGRGSPCRWSFPPRTWTPPRASPPLATMSARWAARPCTARRRSSRCSTRWIRGCRGWRSCPTHPVAEMMVQLIFIREI